MPIDGKSQAYRDGQWRKLMQEQPTDAPAAEPVVYTIEPCEVSARWKSGEPAPAAVPPVRLCADCGQAPADECFTVCSPCWDKAYPNAAPPASPPAAEPSKPSKPLDYTDAFIWLDDLVATYELGSHDELCGLAALDALRRVLPLRAEVASLRAELAQARTERTEDRRHIDATHAELDELKATNKAIDLEMTRCQMANDGLIVERDAALSRATEAEAYLRDVSTILSDAGVLALTVRDGVIELRNRAECAEEDAEDSDGVRGRLADLLERVAIAFKGTPPPLTAWDWSDLPTLAADYKQRAEQAEAALAEARRLIQQVEWGGATCGSGWCPWCRNWEMNGAHKPTCPAFGQQATSQETTGEQPT